MGIRIEGVRLWLALFVGLGMMVASALAWLWYELSIGWAAAIFFVGLALMLPNQSKAIYETIANKLPTFGGK